MLPRKMFPIIGWMSLCLAAALPAQSQTESATTAEGPSLRLFYSGDLLGYIEPCG